MKTIQSSVEQRHIHRLETERRFWGDIFRDSSNFNPEWMHQVFEPSLGCLKQKKHSIQIHRLEKDLIYLSALTIYQRHQVFVSFPVSPVALGILIVVYYAHLVREERDIYCINHAVSAKDFVIWIRPQDKGKLSSLRTTKAVNLIDAWETRCSLGERVLCLPIYKFDESSKSERLKVVMVRSLSEAIELFKRSRYCSLVVIDDPSGCTYPSPSTYGNEAFKLASLCRQKRIPMVGIVPPWTIGDIEYHITNNSSELLLYPIDFFALCSYPAEAGSFSTREPRHPIEESYLRLERKRKSLAETQVTIKTFNFETTEDNEKIADLFQESSSLLIDLGKHPQLRMVWGKGWYIWRYLSAPILPYHLLWGKFIDSALKQLENAATRCKEDKAIILYQCLRSLSWRLYKLKQNPFIEIIKSADIKTIVAVENAECVDALKEEVGRYSYSPHYTSVQVVNIGNVKLSKRINLSKIEEHFSALTSTSLDAGFSETTPLKLEYHYLVEFPQRLKIRVAPSSEFLVLSGKLAQVVPVREITARTKVVLFDGMNRDELFAQKAGLLEDTKVNYLYRVQLEAWRELVKKQVKKSNLQTVCQHIFHDTGISISQETIQHNWMSGHNLLSLPREREHFFWFIPPLARSGFEEFWQRANELRIKRRQLGQVISTCAQEGWNDRKPDEIIFQYQQIFITVGELRDAMQILTVQSSPQLILHPPESPFNRLFRE
ncbi:MAG: hypothetical protein RIB93_17115 [Coleofasciculus sp. D1-CHI-01]|uniref:hypothetical protein n=1 Tax=Coleofasciculus sp. D1-CHI-01 TaxID=3068482 RepID=UPI00330394BD